MSRNIGEACGQPRGTLVTHRAFSSLMKTVICVHLARKPGTITINRSAPMIVRDVNSDWRQAVEADPALLEQIAVNEDVAYFEAEIEDGELEIGGRVPPPQRELH